MKSYILYYIRLYHIYIISQRNLSKSNNSFNENLYNYIYLKFFSGNIFKGMKAI